MIDPRHHQPDPQRVDEQAANWLWRLDRGLTPAEQDAFLEWLAADPTHVEVLAAHRRDWKRLDKLADWRPEHAGRPNPDLLAPATGGRRRPAFYLVPLAAAAVLAVAIGWEFIRSPAPVEPEPPFQEMRHENRRILADGSAVKLNDGAGVTVAYSAHERRVRLDRGEGFFIVTKDPARPFIVEVQGLEVRAVGTAFNVSLGRQTVDVLVAEGAVLVETPGAGKVSPEEIAAARPTALEARQRTSVPLGAESGSSRTILTLSQQEVKRALAWQHGMMTFDQRSLAAIVAELNLLNEQQLVIRDPEVARMQFSGTIRSDNVAGFVRLLESGFRVRSERLAANKIVLRSF